MEILTKLNAVFEAVGMEEFIPKGIKSQEICISDLKRSDVVIFLISPYYGSLIETCVLKDDCKADKCTMKIGNGHISYTNCEYNIAKAEGKLHMTYYISKGWEPVEYIKDLNLQEIEEYSENVEKLKENKIFEDMPNDLIEHYLTAGKEAWKFGEQVKNDEHINFISNIEDPEFIIMVGNHLAENIVEWHTNNNLNFTQFVDREKKLNEIMENIEGKVEVWGVGGVGKTALIEVALLIQKLKGKNILTVGTPKMYASGSGFKDFREKCEEDQYVADSDKEITLHDLINAFAKIKLIQNVEEILKMSIAKQIMHLSKVIRGKKNLILFIDDFHLATKAVVDLAKSVDHVILSSRKNSYVAKDIYLGGIDEEDRENLINLFSEEQLPEEVKKKIAVIAEGHPVSTVILVKNYQRINFDKLKDFELKDANQNQVNDFFRRVIEEIFSSNENALKLLKHLSVINTELETNIERDSVENSYSFEDIHILFNELIDTGMVKKRQGRERVYEFYFKHIQDFLEDEADQDNHENAISYYKQKKKILPDIYSINDEVEVLYHKVKSNTIDDLVNVMLKIKKKILPVHYGFKRLIDIGNELKSLVGEENKTHILVVLGLLYKDLGRFEEAETAYTEALEIRKKLAEKNPDAYNPDVATTQNNLGVLYWNLGRFEEAETAYTEALEIRKKLAKKNPDAYNPDVAMTENNLGNLYRNLGRFREAETAYIEALEIRKKLAQKNPDTYNPEVAQTQNNLGIIYKDLGRFEEAEHTYTEALEIRKKLAEKNPDAYNPDVAQTQNNLGNIYSDAGRFEEAEHTYTEALRIFRELAEKNPEAYNPYVGVLKDNLGTFYQDLGRFEEAEHAHNEALKILKKLAEKNPDAYNPGVANTLINFGVLYVKTNRLVQAEKEFRKALDIYNPLFEKYPEAYRKRLAELWYYYSCLESLKDNKEKSIKHLKKAIELDNKYINEAETEEEFKNIRNLREFKELIGD